MRNSIKGALIVISSIFSVVILAFIHDKIINISCWISYPLILISFVVTLFGILKIFDDDTKSGVQA